MHRLLVWVVVLVTLTGCKVYDEALLQGRDAGPREGCTPLSKPPPRPPGADDGVDVGEGAFAVRNVLFEQDGDRWRTIGYDLDDKCSVAPDFDVECVPVDMSASPEVDGVRGTDNSFGHQLFPLVSVVVPGLQDASRRFQEMGNGSILVRITGWNGEDDDPRVEVEAAVTVFATPGMPDGSAPDITLTPDGPRTAGGAPPPPPAWDGSDYFWARDDNYLDGDPASPLVVDDNAYVAGRVLVVNLPERTDFVFPGDDVGLVARLTDAVATGRISEDRSTWDDVVVAGRWAVLDLLVTAEVVGVCDGTPQYDIFLNQLERISDIRSRAGSGGPGATCDALSVGIAFDGFAAHFGGVAPGPAVENVCAAMMDGGVPTDGGAPMDGGVPMDAGP